MFVSVCAVERESTAPPSGVTMPMKGGQVPPSFFLGTHSSTSGRRGSRSRPPTHCTNHARLVQEQELCSCLLGCLESDVFGQGMESAKGDVQKRRCSTYWMLRGRSCRESGALLRSAGKARQTPLFNSARRREEKACRPMLNSYYILLLILPPLIRELSVTNWTSPE